MGAKSFQNGWWRLILLSLPLILISSPLLAQRRSKQSSRRFKVGDAIEYRWVNQWLPGQVLAVEGNRVGIEFEWGSGARQEVVSGAELRFAWEARALTPMRTWRDESGKFQIRAAAVGLDVGKGTVTLYKDDDSEVTVPIARLSEADRGFLDKASETAIPSLPPLLSFAESSGIGGGAWSAAETLGDVAPDPPPSITSVPMGGVHFPATSPHETVVGLMPIGGSSGWMAAGTLSPLGDVPGRLLWVALAEDKIRQTQLLPPGEALIAVDPSHRQVLTMGEDGDQQKTLTVWKADPTSKRAEPRIRWVSGSAAWATSWAEFLSADRVLHQLEKQKFTVWDIAAQKEAYRIEQESFFGAMPVISPGKRYLALPEDKRVRILELASGKTLASLPIEGGSAAGVAFDREGKQLAILTRSKLAIWQLGSEEPPRQLRADAIGTPFSATLEWVDERSVLIDRATLFDIELQLPVWTYEQNQAEVQRDSFGKRTLSVVDGKLCYVVTVGFQPKVLVVGAVELPGPSVRETVAQVNPEDLYFLKPGGRIKIEVACGSHTPQVQLAITQKIKDNGWVIDPAAAITVVAEMGRGKTQTVEYQNQSGGGGRQSASVTPYFSTLKIMKGDDVAWQSGTSSGLPSVMFLKSGESAQSQANAMQNPNPEFFTSVTIPEKLFDPAYRNGFGTSTIGGKGLVPGPIRLPNGSAANGEPATN